MAEDDTPQRFRVIPGGPAGDEKPKPKPYRTRKRGAAQLLTCWQCELDTGVSGATTMEVKQGRMVRDGKPEGGSRAIICVDCLAMGKVTHLLG
ncbi:hypothetical protein EKE94_03070 [Mesobaculum littorinae]|uniref:Uncharacterized protein n=1 Tax=Mesobaculum littorinae TaxID=2486419 RepID=A0A438ALY3_9RHOB|nr:hypothetical protein [Mesobaculum littorinae]RVV99679.1 hypothetical protein EKE94_03070 [Mesobaculum littorinae]